MRNYLILILIAVMCSCEQKPEVVEAVETKNRDRSAQIAHDIFNNESSDGNVQEGQMDNSLQNVHIVEVLEVLPTKKYVYLKVTENNEEYWIATSKQSVNVGEKYIFRNGILKTNFFSKEYNRVFDKVYLVSKLIPEQHGQGGNAKLIVPKKEVVKGSMRIKDVVEKANSLNGTSVQVTGTCTKINPNIMGRNWIHLKDGSLDDYDFVLTSDQAIPEGHEVTMKGVLKTNQDFGAGYHYDIIIEHASLVRN